MIDIEKVDLEAAGELLRALAHTVRLELLRALVDVERSVGEIEQLTGVGQPTLSQQLGILRKAELVHARRVAKSVFYSINRDRIAEVSALLDAFAGTIAVSRDDAIVTQMRAGGGAAMFARVIPRG